MNKTLFRNILRMIKATKSRFFSLTAIVGLGVAFFIGVYSSSTVMDKSVDYYDDETNLKDITIYSNYGFRQEDVDAVEGLECIEKAEGSYFVDVIAVKGESSGVARVHSYSEDKVINSFVLKEGRMPENEHEALSESGTTITRGYSVGSKVQLTRPEDDLDTYMSVDEVTIVGMIDTPVYMNMTKENSTLSNRPIRTYLYVPEEAFCMDYYLELDALAAGAKELDTFKDEYSEYMDGVTDEVKEFALSQQQENFKEIKQKALEEYNDGLREYRDGEKEFTEKIDEAKKKLSDGEQELADGRRKLEDSIAQLNDAEKELVSQEQSARAQIEDGKRQIEDGLKQIDQGIDQLEPLKDQRTAAQDGLVQIDEGRKMLAKAEAILSLVPSDTKVKDLAEAAGDEGMLDQLKQLDEDAESMTAGELLGVIHAKQSELDDLAGTAQDGLKQIDEGISSFAGAEENRTLAENKAEADELRSKLPALAEDTALLETVSEILPEEYNDVNIDLLVRYHDELFDLMDRIPYEEIDGPKNVGDTIEAAIAFLDSLEEQGQQIDVIKDRLKEIEEEIPAVILDMDYAQYSAVGRDLTDALEELGLNEDGDLHTVGDLNRRSSQMLTEKNEETERIEKQIAELHQEAKVTADAVIDRAVNELKAQRKDVEAKQSDLLDAEKLLEEQLASGRAQIADGWAQVADGREELIKGEAELRDGYAELEKAEKEGQEKLDEAWEKLLDAKETIDSLKNGEWTVLNRKQHYATVTYDATIDQMAAIGRIFPFFFLMVAVLVCLTTMARTVDEQRGEIGILRALGYSRLQCAGKYLIYSASATLLGEVIGVIVGMASFPIVIYNTWRMMYILPAIRIAVQWDLVALTDIAFLLVMLATTWFACSADMKEVPAQLLRPKSPKLGKNMLLEKITFLWKRISFTWKVTIRNIVRYKSRFIMTVGGVAGCTALLVTGFGIKDSISDMVHLHFEQIVQFDGIGAVKDDVSEKDTELLRSEIEAKDEIDLAMLFYSFTSDAYGNAETSDSVRVEVFEQKEDIYNCFDLRTRKGKHPVELTDDGAVINEKLAERAEVKIGDQLEITDEEGRRHTITVAGITEMYIQHYVFMSLDYYEQVCGEVPVSRCIAVKAADSSDLHPVKEALAAYEEIDGIEFYDTTLERFGTMVKSLDLIVWTIIVASMALAFVVLGNLINVNISERQREIATLKVLGFRRGEVQSYIYKENNILTFFGALAGIPLGVWLHSTIMLTVEMDYVMFGRSVTLPSILISVALTVLFGILVNWSMRKRLHNIKMVESLKSVE